MKRPNILLITADQQRGDCFGFEGRRIRTPHLDALAAAGTRFSAAICPSVVCQPSRASMLTGLLPLTHGVHDNGIDLDPATGQRGFAGRLADAGYATAFFGKAHFSTYHTFQPTGTPECVASSAQYGPDWNGPYMGFQHAELMLVGHNWFPPEAPPRGQHYERYYHADGQGAAKHALYRQSAFDTQGAAQCWHSELPLMWHNTPWTADRAIAWLHDRPRDKPFCAWVSFPDPHHPFDCPLPWSRLHHPSEVDLPPHRTRDLDRRPWWHRAVLESEPVGPPDAVATRKAYSRIAPQTDAQLREIIANTYGMIAMIDHEVGRLRQALLETGAAEHTIIIYTADHGDWLGDHGLILKGPMPYEGLLRVGLIMQGAGLPAGHVVPDPVSTLDLAATFLDLAGAPPAQLHGASLLPVIRGQASRDVALSEWELLPARTGVALSLRVARGRRWKLALELRSGAGELYDLADDPHELHNRFDDPAAAEARATLTAAIMARPDDAGPLRIPVGTA